MGYFFNREIISFTYIILIVMTRLGRTLAVIFGVINVGGSLVTLINSHAFDSGGIATAVFLTQLLTGAFLLFLAINSD